MVQIQVIRNIGHCEMLAAFLKYEDGTHVDTSAVEVRNEEGNGGSHGRGEREERGRGTRKQF